jgi:hypothetical protein
MRILAAVLLVVALLGPGCLDQAPQAGLAKAGDAVGQLLAPSVDQALWNDPQLFPHPAYNWPTITHVPPEAPVWWQPIAAAATPDPVTSIQPLAQVGRGSGHDGYAVFGRLVVSPSGQIYDITDPAKPTVLATLSIKPSARQAVVIPFPDGHLYAAYATGSGNVPIWDITDPKNATEVHVFKVPSGGHTIGVVPGTPILYNANAVGSRYYPHEISGGKSIVQVEIYDLSNPDDPKLIKEWKNGEGCHELSFYLKPGKLRAYCAAVDATQIWDITDPKNPSVISTVPMPHGQRPVPGYPILATVSHYVVVNDDASVMGVADEYLGGVGPGCDVYQRPMGRTVSGPSGNVFFYDIKDEKAPVLKGWINPGAHFTYNPPAASNGNAIQCTAHIGRMVPQAKTDLMAMSFYAGGVGLIDFTDPAQPFFAATWQKSTPMDAWYYNGYLFLGDASHGLDVLTLR